MRFLVLLIFLGLVICGGLLVKPVYREHIENDLSRQTRQLLNEKGWRGVKISYDHLSPIADGTSVLTRSKIIRAIDRNVWGAYVDPESIRATTLSPAKVIISIDRESKLVVLSGTVPNRELRRKLQQAAESSSWTPDVDNILLVDDRLPPPSWENAAPAFFTKFISADGTSGLTLSDAGGLVLEGRVEFNEVKLRLEKEGAAFSSVKSLLQSSDLK